MYVFMLPDGNRLSKQDKCEKKHLRNDEQKPTKGKKHSRQNQAATAFTKPPLSTQRFQQIPELKNA